MHSLLAGKHPMAVTNSILAISSCNAVPVSTMRQETGHAARLTWRCAPYLSGLHWHKHALITTSWWNGYLYIM